MKPSQRRTVPAGSAPIQGPKPLGDPAGGSPAYGNSSPQGSEDPWVEHLGWVRRLALRLARDEAAADDLVQRTALVALRRRDAVRAAGAGGGVRGWLRRVLYHEARSGWRRDRNRRAREADYADGRPSPVQGPDAAAGSLEFTKQIVAAVEGLDEAQGAAVVARYFHGQSVADIALDQGVPVRTVETRLRRAREKMRARLSSAGGVGMGGWAPMVLLHWGGSDLGGLVTAGTTAGITSGSAAAAKTAAGAPWGTVWLAGIMAMNVKVVLGCTAALVAGLIGALQWSAVKEPAELPDAGQQVTSQDQRPEPSALVAVEGTGRLQQESRPHAGPEGQQPAPAAPAESFVTLIEALPPGSLDVWVVDEASQPVVGAKVMITEGLVFTGWGPPEVNDGAPRQVKSVGPGRGAGPIEPIRFEGLANGTWFLQVTSPSGARRVESVKMDPERGSTKIVRFGAGRIFGRVTDGTEADQPVRGAYLTLMTKRRIDGFTDQQLEAKPPLHWSAAEASSLHVKTDENGEYSLDELTGGSHSFALNESVLDLGQGSHVEIPARYLRVRLKPGEQRRMDFPPGTQEGAAVWRGRVVDGLGNPVVTPDFNFRRANIRVASWDDKRLEKPATFQGRGDANFDKRLRYELDGSFEMRLPPGRYDVWLSSPHHEEAQHVLEAADFELAPGQRLERDLVLPGVTLRGTVDQSLLDTVRRSAELQPYGKPTLSVVGRLHHVKHSGGMHYGGIDASGVFTLYGLGPGEWVLSGFKRARTELVIPGDVQEATVVLLPK